MDTRFSIKEQIGAGAYGIVYSAFDLKLCRHVAIKVITPSGSKAQQHQDVLAELEKEFEMLLHLEHPNIVRVLDCVRISGAVHIVMEWMSAGTVASLIREHVRLHEGVVRHFLKDALEGLSFLHERKIIHADIKPQNLLLSPEGRVKISDFGTSQQLSETRSGTMDGLVGTVRFLAPEIIQQPRYSTRADIWSLAASATTMLSGELPWAHVIPPGRNDMLPLIFTIGNVRTDAPHHPVIPPHVSDDLRRLLEACFAIDPQQRPTAKELLHDPYFAASQSDPLPASAESLEQYRNTIATDARDAASSTACSAAPPIVASSAGYKCLATVEESLTSMTKDKLETAEVASPANDDVPTHRTDFSVASKQQQQQVVEPKGAASKEPKTLANREPGAEILERLLQNNNVIQWQWAYDSRTFRDFTPPECEFLSSKFIEMGGVGSFNMRIKTPGLNRPHVINWDEMTQKNPLTHRKRKIRPKLSP